MITTEPVTLETEAVKLCLVMVNVISRDIMAKFGDHDGTILKEQSSLIEERSAIKSKNASYPIRLSSKVPVNPKLIIKIHVMFMWNCACLVYEG